MKSNESPKYNPLNIQYDIFDKRLNAEINNKPNRNVKKQIYTTVEFDIINACNLKCPLCFRQENKDKIKSIGKSKLSTEDFKQFMEDAKSNSRLDIKLIRFIGTLSEPLLHKDLPELVTIANEYGASVQISTNLNIKTNVGNTLNLNYLVELNRALSNNPQNELLIALESIDQEVYSKYRVNGNLKQVLNNLNYFISRKFKIGIQFIKFPWNEGHLDKINEYFHNNDYIHTFTPDFYEILECNDVGESSINKVLNEFKPRDQVNNKFYKMRNNFIEQNQKINSVQLPKIYCACLTYGELFIDVKGLVHPCTNMFENQGQVTGSKIDPIHFTQKNFLDSVDEVVKDRYQTQECFKACSQLGHVLEKPYQRKRKDYQ